MLTKFCSFTLASSLFIFTACGNQSNEGKDASEVIIPDAPDAAIKTILTEFGKGDAGILWDAMPESYQLDIDTLAKLAGEKADPEVYNKSFQLVDKLAGVLSKQQNFILGSVAAKSDGSPESVESLEQLKTAIPEVVKVLQTLTQSSLATVEGLQGFSGETFFDTTITSLTEQFKSLSELSGEGISLEDINAIEVKTIDSDELSATLSMVAPGEEPQLQSFTKVDGRWVPTDMASVWDLQVEQAKSQLSAVTDEERLARRPQLLGALTMIDGLLTQINAAETQAQFDQAVQGAMMPLFGLMMMFQQPAPAAPAPVTP